MVCKLLDAAVLLLGQIALHYWETGSFPKKLSFCLFSVARFILCCNRLQRLGLILYPLTSLAVLATLGMQ